MKLEWSQFAIEDRETIFDYIEEESPQAAALVDERIGSQIEHLIQFPERGRRGRIEGTRELVISHTSYVVAYSVIGDAVRILSILHSSQLWPEKLDE